MQSIIPMLSNSPVLTFSVAPHFVWVVLAVVLVAGLAIMASVLRAQHRRSAGAGRARSTSKKPVGVLSQVERPIAA